MAFQIPQVRCSPRDHQPVLHRRVYPPLPYNRSPFLPTGIQPPSRSMPRSSTPYIGFVEITCPSGGQQRTWRTPFLVVLILVHLRRRPCLGTPSSSGLGCVNGRWHVVGRRDKNKTKKAAEGTDTLETRHEWRRDRLTPWTQNLSRAWADHGSIIGL